MGGVVSNPLCRLIPKLRKAPVKGEEALRK